MAKRYITFEEIMDTLYNLPDDYLSGFDKVIAITRGGLFITGFLTQKFGFRNVDTLSFKSYEEQEQGNLQILKAQVDLSDKILVIDDIADSGKSLEVAKLFYPNAKTFTFHYKAHSTVKPDYYMFETTEWIVYPWELER